MLRVSAWCSGLAAIAALAYFVPIHPAVLTTVGLGSKEELPPTYRIKTDGSVELAKEGPASMSAKELKQRMEIRVVRVLADKSGKRYQQVASLGSDRAAAHLASDAPQAADEVAASSAHHLISSLQRELQRVGCYGGDIDGDWGPASRFAMSAFVQVVSTPSPIEEPDADLLTMVQGYSGRACSGGRFLVAPEPGLAASNETAERQAPGTEKSANDDQPRRVLVLRAGKPRTADTSSGVRPKVVNLDAARRQAPSATPPPDTAVAQSVGETFYPDRTRMSLGAIEKATVSRQSVTNPQAGRARPDADAERRNRLRRAAARERRAREAHKASKSRPWYRKARRSRRKWQRDAFSNEN